MKCEFCGHDNDPGVKFCGKCGAQIPDSTSRSEKTNIKEAVSSIANMFKVLPIKKLLRFIIPVALIVVILIIAVPILRGLNISTSGDSISFFSNIDGIVVVSGNNNERFTIDGEMFSFRQSMDGSRAVVLTDYSGSSGGTLWFVNTSGAVRIAEDVLAYQLSDSGKGVTYLTDYDSSNETATLFLYDTPSKNTTRVSDEVMFERGYRGDATCVCISPNGKSIGYISDYDSSREEFTGYVKIDGKKAEKLGNNMLAIAVSDGGKYIYYAKIMGDGDDISLHVKNGRNDNRLIPDITFSYETSMMLNKDYSEVIFNIEDKSFISRNGKERTRMSRYTIDDLLLPQGSKISCISRDAGVGDIAAYGVRSFKNTLVVTDGGVEYINNKFETERISGSSSSSGYRSVVSNDGKSLLFINTFDKLVRVNVTKLDAEKVELDKDVKTFVASGDGKTVYYLNYFDELWCIRGNRKPFKIADYVTYDHLVMSNNSKKVFFLVDYSHGGGDLYYSDNGKKSVRIAEDVKDVWSTPANIFYMNTDSDVFRSNGNEKFTLFQEDASMLW